MKRSLFFVLVLVVVAYFGSSCSFIDNPVDPGLVIYEYHVDINPDPDPNVVEEPIWHFGVWGYVYLPSNPTIYYEGIEIVLTVHIPDGESLSQSVVTNSDGYYEISFYDTVQHGSLTAEVVVNNNMFLPNEVSLSYENGALVEDDGDECVNWLKVDFKNQTDELPHYNDIQNIQTYFSPIIEKDNHSNWNPTF